MPVQQSRGVKPRKLSTPEKVGPLPMQRLGEFHTTISAIQQFVNEAWGNEADLLLQYERDLTIDVVPTLPTFSMRRRAKHIRRGDFCRDLPLLLRVACHDGLISNGRYHIAAQ